MTQNEPNKGFEANATSLVGGTSISSLDRLLELQRIGTELEVIPFLNWSETLPRRDSAKLEPNSTKFFRDGWDRYTRIIKPDLADERGMPATFELYVAPHNTVYRYDLRIPEDE